MSPNYRKFIFVLGRETKLCEAELVAVLERLNFCFSDLIVADNILSIKLDFDPRLLIDILGGTKKIFEITREDVKEDEIFELTLKDIVAENTDPKGSKVRYGFSDYSGRLKIEAINKEGLRIKAKLKERGISSRFIALRKDNLLSTIVSSSEKLYGHNFEFAIFQFNGLFCLARLVATTNPKEWQKRDFQKPFCDKFSGMLPPKLARMLINLSLTEKDSPLVLDPFCGSGNILMESLALGYDCFGSDKSAKAVSDSEANLKWYQTDDKTLFKVAQADARTFDFREALSQSFPIGSYSEIAVVSEPYLGLPKKTKLSHAKTLAEYQEVKELYISFLKNIANLFKSSHYRLNLSLVFPLVETIEGQRFSLYNQSVDEIKEIGYTSLRFPLIYGRDYQIVKREIIVLTLNRF